MADGRKRPAREPEEPEDPALAIAARHALHDEELVAAFATDGVAADNAERAKSLIDRCAACRDLHADVMAIGGVLRAAANAETVGVVQRAPRDFRLSVETANQLRPGSVVYRLRDRVAAAIAALSRPVGVSMASLGVVGMLLGALTFGGFANLGTAPVEDGGTGAAGSSPLASDRSAPEASQATGEVTGPAGSPPESTRMSFDAQASQAPASAAPPSGAAPSPSLPPAVTGEAPMFRDGSPLSGLIVGASAVLLIGGLALLAFGSRRGEPILGR